MPSHRRSDVDELRALAARAEAMAARLETRFGDDRPLALDLARELVPAARLHAYSGRDGAWYAHLLMPDGWSPRNPRGWMSPQSEGATYWTSVTGATRREVLLKGVRLLLDLEREEDCPCHGACHNGATPTCSDACRFAVVVHR